MIRRLLGLGALFLVALPVALAGQERTCRQVLPSDARRLMNAGGQEIIYFLDPVRVLCTGGLTIEADSAVMNRSTASVQLVGNVVYRDSAQQLTSDWANYVGARDQLLARGSVAVENLEDGSIVQGDELDYLRETDERPVSRMIVRGRRPYARIPPQADSGATADTAASTEVWADRMEFEGRDVFRGLGNVELVRGDMTGASDTATFDRPSELMQLTGSAHVQTERYRLEGARIDAHIDGREIHSVLADRNARVESEDLTVDAERIQIGFSSGQLERLEAWNPEPDSVARALADATSFRLRSDSIDARADSLGLREVRAVGRAYGERGPDSAAVGLPAAVRMDWIQGDTILGFFTRRPLNVATPAAGQAVPTARPDTMGPSPVLRGEGPGLETGSGADTTETVLERIVVIGGSQPALSLYHLASEDETADPSLNFMKATRITLFMARGEVSRVEADGPLEGLYLSPVPRPEETGEGGAGGEGGDGAANEGPATGLQAGGGTR